jgi:O-antigen ligase
MMRARMNRRWLFAAISLLAAMMFATAVWAAPWWINGEVTIGPFGARSCFGGECRPTGLRWAGGTDLWMRSAIATGAAGVIAMLTSLGVAGGFAARREPVLVAKMSLVSIACAIACAAYFVTKMPELQGTAIGAGMILYAAAIVTGSVTPLAVLRRRRRA